jgi:hypothetical protein
MALLPWDDSRSRPLPSAVRRLSASARGSRPCDGAPPSVWPRVDRGRPPAMSVTAFGDVAAEPETVSESRGVERTRRVGSRTALEQTDDAGHPNDVVGLDMAHGCSFCVCRSRGVGSGWVDAGGIRRVWGKAPLPAHCAPAVACSRGRPWHQSHGAGLPVAVSPLSPSMAPPGTSVRVPLRRGR